LNPSPLVLSSADRERIAQVDMLAAQGASRVDDLALLLDNRSWAVRRAVVAALARVGQPAVPVLAKSLITQRDNEARIAAVVDALSASRGDAAAPMLEILHDPQSSPALLCDAAQVLGRRKVASAAHSLEKLAAHPDDNVGVAAIEALGRIGAGAGLEGLVAVLATKNFFRIFPAIDVLGRSGDPRVLLPLTSLLDDQRYALEAARALGRAGDPGAAPALASLLRRANDALARVIATSLAAIHARALSLYGTADPVEASLRSGDKDLLPLVQRLAQAVEGAVPEEQEAICTVLAWIRDPVAAETLIGLLDSTPGAASVALRALGRESDGQILQALREGESSRRALLLPLISARTRSAKDVLECLGDPDPSVRVLACNALARIGDTSAVPRLFELLRDPDPMLSQAAVAAIQSLGSAGTEALALQAARAPQPHLRRAALRIVAYFGYPAGLELLIEAVQGADERLRDAAIHGLALLDDPRALSALIGMAAHSNPRARGAAVRALGQAFGGGEVLAVLRAGLSDRDAWVRYYACQSLGRLQDDGAVDAILLLVQDSAGQVRVAAIEALARLDTAAALQALQAAAGSDDPDVQRAALLGLGSRRAPEALLVLQRAALSPDAATRLIALSAIAGYQGPDGLAAISSATSDPDAAVRDAAIGFLPGREEPAATAALIGLLTNPLVRERAVESLAISPSRTTGIAAALEGAGPELSSSLIAVLARSRRPDALAAIIDALTLPNVFARRAAAAALGALRTPEARAALEHAIDSDPDPEVRRAGLAAAGP
jgi:HEAT repeat protein